MSSTDSDYNLSEILSAEDQKAIYGDEDVQNTLLHIGEILDSSNYNTYLENSIKQEYMPIADPIPPITLIYPPEEPIVLSTEDYPGPFTFEVCIAATSNKHPWEYSVKLNKIFVDINNSIPLDFSIKTEFPNYQLYVRATPIYTNQQFAHEIVHRCLNHESFLEPINKDLPVHVLQHVLRCTNNGTKYVGDYRSKKRLSLILPLSSPQVGTTFVREIFTFVCKTSCPGGGMNRKPINVIFTLENAKGDIFGRRSMCVRICSCPKRDMEKEEKEANPGTNSKKKEKLNNKTAKKTNIDNKIYKVSFHIIGKKNFKKVMKNAIMVMKSELLDRGVDGVDESEDEIFKKYIADYTKQIDKLD